MQETYYLFIDFLNEIKSRSVFQVIINEIGPLEQNLKLVQGVIKATRFHCLIIGFHVKKSSGSCFFLLEQTCFIIIPRMHSRIKALYTRSKQAKTSRKLGQSKPSKNLSPQYYFYLCSNTYFYDMLQIFSRCDPLKYVSHDFCVTVFVGKKCFSACSLHTYI